MLHGRTTEECKLFDKLIVQFSSFPGLVKFSKKASRAPSALIRKKCLQAQEAQSIRSIILAVIEVWQISEEERSAWRWHVLHASGYLKDEWSENELAEWRTISMKFTETLQHTYCHLSNFTMPKGHDPVHCVEIVDEFGSFNNIDEMNFEIHHTEDK